MIRRAVREFLVYVKCIHGCYLLLPIYTYNLGSHYLGKSKLNVLDWH